MSLKVALTRSPLYHPASVGFVIAAIPCSVSTTAGTILLIAPACFELLATTGIGANHLSYRNQLSVGVVLIFSAKALTVGIGCACSLIIHSLPY